MVLILGADGRVTDGPVPSGTTATVVALYQGRLTQVLVQNNPPGGGGAGGWSDGFGFALELGVADTVAAQAEALDMFADALFGDTNLARTDAVEFGFSGFDEVNPARTETYGSLLTRWATTNTTAGTAPVNPTNAQGSKDGTTATVKAGGLANGTSTINLTIVAPLPGTPSGSTPTLRAYYSITAGVTDTFTCTVSYRQVGQGTNTTLNLPVTGNYLAAGTTLALTNIDPTFTVTATFTHAATTPATGGNIAVDAVGVETTGAL